MKFYPLEGILAKWRYQKAWKIVKDKKNILEIGCGANASFLRSLAQLPNKKLIGLDPKLKKNIPQSKNIFLIKEKVFDRLNFEDNSFDCVIMLAVLEHLDKPGEIIEEIHRVLDPGGCLCLSAPTGFAKRILEFWALIKLLDPAHVAEHKNYFNKQGLEAMAQKAGFSKTRHQYFQLGCNNFFMAFKSGS